MCSQVYPSGGPAVPQGGGDPSQGASDSPPAFRKVDQVARSNSPLGDSAAASDVRPPLSLSRPIHLGSSRRDAIREQLEDLESFLSAHADADSLCAAFKIWADQH